MPTRYKIQDQEAAYYMTLQVVEWVDIFTRHQCRDIVVESLKYCQQQKGLIIIGWVIMSNHIHMLAQSSENDLSGAIRDFKKFTSKALIDFIQNNNKESRKEWMLRIFKNEAAKTNRNKDFQVWTHENHFVQVYSDKFVKEKLDYIHNNPVKAGIVEKAEDYIYSSAKNYAGEKGN